MAVRGVPLAAMLLACFVVPVRGQPADTNAPPPPDAGAIADAPAAEGEPAPAKLNESGFTISPDANPLTSDDYRRLVGFVQAESGDELTIAERAGLRGSKIKLWGIDAPEMAQICRTKRGIEYNCGEFSKNALTTFTKDKQVLCTVLFTTVQRVQVARCQMANVDVAGAMIAAGWAFAAPHVTSNYDRIQSKAQARKLGMWAGRVEPPWNFRSRLEADANADPAPPMITYNYQR